MRPPVEITRHVAAPPAAVFAAWTDGDRLARWFGPAEAEREAACDPRPDGAWSIRMRIPKGPTFGYRGAYLIVDAPSLLAFTMIADGQEGVETCRVELAPDGDGTHLRFTQEGDSLTIEQYEQAEAAWAVFLEQLERVAAEG